VDDQGMRDGKGVYTIRDMLSQREGCREDMKGGG